MLINMNKTSWFKRTRSTYSYKDPGDKPQFYSSLAVWLSQAPFRLSVSATAAARPPAQVVLTMNLKFCGQGFYLSKLLLVAKARRFQLVGMTGKKALPAAPWHR
jgi:hypothetical protein